MAEGYQCCFCGKSIEQTDRDAVQLIAQNLWQRDPYRDAAQVVFAHSECASRQMSAGQFTPSVLHDPDTNYSLQEIVWGENEGERGRVPLWTCITVLIALAAGAYLLLR